MSRKTKIAEGVGAALAANAGKPTADHVVAAAKVKGAATGKDAVPAGINWNLELGAIAKDEVAAIVIQVNAMGDRMACWQRVAKLGEGKPSVFDAYSGIVRDQLLVSAGLTLEQAQGKRELWSDTVKALYEKSLSKRVSETRKAMSALTSDFTATRKVLEGKGTIHQKLAALPNPTKKGRKKGSKSGAAGKTTAPAKTGKTGDGIAQVTTLLSSMTFDQLTDCAYHLLMQMKGRKEYKSNADGRKFVDALNAAHLHYIETMDDDSEQREAA